jgi:hypothetical protein
MAFNVHTEGHIPTEEARNIVIPILQDWFDLGDKQNILEDISISRSAGGGAAIEITLGLFVPAEKYAQLEDALRAKGVMI